MAVITICSDFAAPKKKVCHCSHCFPSISHEVMTLSSYKFYAFKLWCWRRLLRVPWTARRSNQSILKEINPEYSLEGRMLKVKLQESGHLMWRANSLEKTLMLGKTEDRRRRGQQRIRWVDGIIDSMNMNMSSSKLQEVVKDRKTVWWSAWSCKDSDMTD